MSLTWLTPMLKRSTRRKEGKLEYITLAPEEVNHQITTYSAMMILTAEKHHIVSVHHQLFMFEPFSPQVGQ
jgi:hypothetical protein